MEDDLSAIICPICESNNTIPFSDTIFKTFGFECQNCHSDFGVNSTKDEISNYINNVSEFYFTYKESEKLYKVFITTLNSNSYLIATYNDLDKKVMSNEIDFTSVSKYFFETLFKNLFILDWKSKKVSEENFLEIVIKFKNDLETIKIITDKYTIYYNFFREVFTPIFDQLIKD